MQRNDSESPPARIARLADQCVKCGLCLPHCPTFALAGDEAESPRGRIALVQGLASGRVPLTATLAGHLDRCLACRACEAVCPAGVRYGELIDAGRAELLRRGYEPGRLERLLGGAVARPGLMRLAARLVRLYAGSWLQRGIRRLPLPRRLRRLESLLPSAAPARRRPAPGAGDGRPRVALFTGCLQPALEPGVLDDARLALELAGYDVTVPPGQGCCGALHLHAGWRERAGQLVRRNVEAFGGDADGCAIAVTASGCAATLREYDGLGEGSVKAAGFAARVGDVSTLLARAPAPPVAQAPRSPLRVAVHEPCTLRNVLRSQQAVYELLERLPGVSASPLAGNGHCCGAAGAYLVTQPDIADRLLQAKLDAIAASGAGVVVTSNVGCAAHLRAGLERAGSAVRVLHPASLAAAAWKEKEE